MVTIQNGQGSQGFDGYTTPDGNCVNPAFIAQFFDQMGQALQAAICDGRVEDRVYVLEQFAGMQSVLDTLVNQDGFTAQVQQLQQLINSLQDQDGDGVNDLQQVKDRLDALESSYNTHQQQLLQHGQQLTNLQTTQATHEQQIAALQDQYQNLDAAALGVDLAAMRCEVVTDVFNAVEVGFNAFAQRLSVDCVLPTSLDQVNGDPEPEGDAPGGDAPDPDAPGGENGPGIADDIENPVEGEDAPDVL